MEKSPYFLPIIIMKKEISVRYYEPPVNSSHIFRMYMCVCAFNLVYLNALKKSIFNFVRIKEV